MSRSRDVIWWVLKIPFSNYIMDGSKCILQLRGVRPFLSDKYDITRHPNYKYTSDFDKKYTFDIEKYLNRRMRLKAEDEYEVISA